MKKKTKTKIFISVSSIVGALLIALTSFLIYYGIVRYKFTLRFLSVNKEDNVLYVNIETKSKSNMRKSERVTIYATDFAIEYDSYPLSAEQVNIETNNFNNLVLQPGQRIQVKFIIEDFSKLQTIVIYYKGVKLNLGQVLTFTN